MAVPVPLRERIAPWGHAPLRGSRREPAVAQLSTLGDFALMAWELRSLRQFKLVPF
jgi:hypothetical protein